MVKAKKKGKDGAKGKTSSSNSHGGTPAKKTKSFSGKNHNKSKVMGSTEADYKFRNSLEAGKAVKRKREKCFCGNFSPLYSDGLSVVDMAPDGNCLFRALSDQLYGDYGNRHEEIRSDICEYMEENKEDFKVFLVLDDDSCEEGDDGKDFESYIQKMREDGEWGGNLELVAAARLYQ